MTNEVMTYTDTYGWLPTSIARLAKRKNVSPADMDFMLDQFSENNWDLVEAHIIDNSPNGYYTPRYF